MQGERPLDTDPERLLADRERLPYARALALDDDALEHLDALALALDHLEMDAHGVPGFEPRDFTRLAALDIGDDAHQRKRNGRPTNASHRARASQVGAARRGAAALGRLPPPPRHLGVVARAQHVRHPPPPEPLRPGVVRVFGQAAERLRVGVLLVALAPAERAVQLARDGIDHGHRGDLAAGEDVATD